MVRAVMAVDPAAMTEAQFQAAVIAQARAAHWGVTVAAAKRLADDAAAYGVDAPPLDGLIYHPRYSLGSEPGWPDLTLVRRRDRRLIFAELKGPKGVLSRRQEEVLDLLRSIATPRGVCGEGPHPIGLDGNEVRLPCCQTWIEVHVWRPSDLEAIAEILR